MRHAIVMSKKKLQYFFLWKNVLVDAFWTRYKLTLNRKRSASKNRCRNLAIAWDPLCNLQFFPSSAFLTSVKVHLQHNKRSDNISQKKLLSREKREMSNIHPHIFNAGITVTIGLRLPFTCLFTCPWKKWPFWRASFYTANQSNLKSFQ